METKETLEEETKIQIKQLNKNKVPVVKVSNKVPAIKTPAVKLPELDVPAIETEIDFDALEEIEWIVFSSQRQQRDNEPLQLMVYFRTDEKNSKHGRITFSYFLSEKYGADKKFKFGALKGKIIFQVTDKEGLPAKLSSKPYSKLCISNRGIAEVICEKYAIEQSNQSTYFKLKDLGNDFYLIDEIIK